MKWVTVKTMPIIFFAVGLVISLVAVLITAILNFTGATNLSVLQVSSIFGFDLIITILWYLVLWVTGKLKDETGLDKFEGYQNAGLGSSSDDDDWE